MTVQDLQAVILEARSNGVPWGGTHHNWQNHTNIWLIKSVQRLDGLVERFCVCVFCKMWNPHTHCNMKPAPGLTWTLVGSHLGLKCLLMPWQLITTMQISVKWNHNLPTHHTPHTPQPDRRDLCDTEIYILRNSASKYLCLWSHHRGRVLQWRLKTE